MMRFIGVVMTGLLVVLGPAAALADEPGGAAGGAGVGQAPSGSPGIALGLDVHGMTPSFGPGGVSTFGNGGPFDVLGGSPTFGNGGLFDTGSGSIGGWEGLGSSGGLSFP